MALTTLHLAKENFKFSSAHFLIFDEKNAEMLHGHNYQVRIDISGSENSALSQLGYLVDFKVLKKIIKARLDQWDEHVLLPAQHPDMKYKVSSDGKNYEIHFRDRFYSLPLNEVIWLEVSNTSVEQLSLLLAKEFFQALKKYHIKKICVEVEETRGQSASATIEL
ncbi:MAG: 6-pyruvoyl tetrahydropterin synthase [Bdellovibrionales bacterium RIFCSPHIGHO2_01_FULL_40_29]|nr:MAG: 6-pyruvoyl tetrahydropterin synthase [Bdellovibrionales bacterium RIFCSPHIGHO2_01_FULL_40_29]OFZ34219.1 MAG: 6-pyruvoyl tetrahydropterin synthase [Bdellovibrionales bacterium RIFCSPHIGHO2_02_FULL_40_15]